MAKTRANLPSNVVPVAAYPSCEDCLSWGDEGVAVGAGQNVYLIQSNKTTLDSNVSPATSWSTSTLRVDQFDDEEWPEKPLSTICHFSIGEEQSESHVASVQFSPPGIGIHRRSVLAVLTTNLLLSLWETDGSQRGWKRTCVLNQLLTEAIHDKEQVDEPTVPRRIRAFAWSHPLITSSTHRWGFQYMTLVDDSGTIFFFQLQKAKPEQYGTWTASCLHTTPLSRFVSPCGLTHKTHLQKMIVRKSPIQRIELLPWSISNDKPPSDSTTEATASLRCARGVAHADTLLAVRVTLRQHQLNSCSIASLDHANPSWGTRGYQCDLSALQRNRIIHSIDESPEWREPLQSICADFDTANQLNGLYRIRFWGITESASRQEQAACISLHPWDCYEYGSAVHEKSYAIFRRLASSNLSVAPFQKTELEVLKAVLQEINKFLGQKPVGSNQLDLTLLRIFRSWATATGSHPEAVLVLERSISQSTGVQTSNALNPEDQSLSETETCEICGAKITFDANISSAVCEAGHSFARCSLCLLGIQEPGITKYCSLCKRQFLNPSKLGTQQDSSLISHLFDAFDVCPYCGGKFCG